MPLRVLIVEAETQLAPVVQEGLAALDPGIEIDRAVSVNAAVDRLSAVGYDLIVSDEEIGGMRAGPFLRHLCERRFPTVPFMLLSSGAGEAERREEPDPTLLHKPFSADELRERLVRLLD